MKMKIMKQNKTALVRAVDLLAVRAHSVKMLTDKLLHKGYDEDEVQAAINVLLERGYLNDEELCKSVYRQYVGEKKYSIRQIEYKLLQKGFMVAMIEASRQELDNELEKATAYKILVGKYKLSQKVEQIKMIQYLYSKGFRKESISDAICKFTASDCREFIGEI